MTRYCMRLATMVALLTLPWGGGLGAQQARIFTRGLQISAHALGATGFDLSYQPGTYQSKIGVRQITAEDAYIGSSSFGGGIGGTIGVGITRHLAGFAGFDFVSSKFDHADGVRRGSTQKAVMAGGRVSLPIARLGGLPYVYGVAGVLELTGVEQRCRTPTGCMTTTNDYGGDYLGAGAGYEFSPRHFAGGVLAFDVRAEAGRAWVGRNEGADELYRKFGITRFRAGAVWHFMPPRE